MMDSRRDREQTLALSTRDPTHPCVGIRRVGNTVLKVPVIARIGELTERVVRRDCIASPTAHSHAQQLQVSCICGEVDAVDVV